jgi:ABC-type antimicrobial peptide transport system permease subunit
MFRYLPSNFSRSISLLGTTVLVRTSGDIGPAMTEARRAIESIDRDLAVFNAGTMAHDVGQAMMVPRVCAALFGIFGGIGLVLASVGLFGVVNYSVRTRTKEIGIRLALGAKPSRIVGGIARQGLVLVIAGVAIGLGISLFLSRYMTSLLYGVTATDPFTFFVVPSSPCPLCATSSVIRECTEMNAYRRFAIRNRAMRVLDHKPAGRIIGG